MTVAVWLQPLSLLHLFNEHLNESDSRDWQGGLKTPSVVGLLIDGKGPPRWLFVFFGGAEHNDNSLVTHVRAAEKQKNRGRCGPSISWPTLRVFLMLTASGTYAALLEMWVMTRPKSPA